MGEEDIVAVRLRRPGQKDRPPGPRSRRSSGTGFVPALKRVRRLTPGSVPAWIRLGHVEEVRGEAHEHWHIEVAYLSPAGTLYYGCSFLDRGSRTFVYWDVRESIAEEEVKCILQPARELWAHARPRMVSANGPHFIGRDFTVPPACQRQDGTLAQDRQGQRCPRGITQTRGERVPSARIPLELKARGGSRPRSRVA